MRWTTMRWQLSLLAIVLLASQIQADDQVDFFESRIRPVLVEHCYACHSSEGSDIEGGLRVDSREAMRRGGESGPAITPNQVDKSLLVSAIKYESLEMPPDRKLPDSVVADFVKWIDGGAVDPREESTTPVEHVESTIDFELGRQFWAFQSPTRHQLPHHDLQSWCRTDIDHFVAAKLEAAKLAPSAEAESATLLRRVAMDLTGLPPSEQMRARVEQLGINESYERVINELLGSPTFGEHWARLWLDVMRFADDQAHIVGDNRSLFFPNSYLYRDWVTDSLNADMRYDEFVRLQLAADLLTPEIAEDDVALGFMGLGPKYYQRNSPAVMADEWEDRVDTLSRGLLGLTVACARCHDHKFDPIGTADYYAMAGVFASIEMFNRPLDTGREKDNKGSAKNPSDSVHIVRETDPVDLAIMVRGDVNRKGEVVPRRFLTVLYPTEPKPFQNGSGRLELAHEITSPTNPLLARVFVNRVWGKLMGQPLVATPSNFGKLGVMPSHPELLDDLSVRFMKNGWSLKWLCREIVRSATYQQTSEVHELGIIADEANQLLWRMNRKRLGVEQWRDAILVASGNLDLSIGGTSIDPSDPVARRRTLYSEASRLKLNPMLAMFDYPDPNAHSAKRAITTTPTQKLFVMNSPFFVSNAREMANRLRDTSDAPKQFVQRAYELLYSRSPSELELRIGIEFLDSSELRNDQYIHALMAANEMFFID